MSGLLQGRHSSVDRALTAKVGALGFNFQCMAAHALFPSVCFYPDLPLTTSSYHQLLLISIVTKNNRVYIVMYKCSIILSHSFRRERERKKTIGRQESLGFNCDTNMRLSDY